MSVRLARFDDVVTRLQLDVDVPVDVPVDLPIDVTVDVDVGANVDDEDDAALGA